MNGLKGNFEALNIHAYRLFSHVVFTLYVAMLSFHPLLFYLKNHATSTFTFTLSTKHTTDCRQAENEERGAICSFVAQFFLILPRFVAFFLFK